MEGRGACFPGIFERIQNGFGGYRAGSQGRGRVRAVSGPEAWLGLVQVSWNRDRVDLVRFGSVRFGSVRFIFFSLRHVLFGGVLAMLEFTDFDSGSFDDSLVLCFRVYFV